LQIHFRHRGFTLTELLIVVASILFLAAIFIPRITNSHIAPREAAALASLNDIHSADAAYAASHPQAGFAQDLNVLADFSKASGRKGVDQELATGHKTGYVGHRTQERLRFYLQSWSNGQRHHSVVHGDSGAREGWGNGTAPIPFR
jgi:prepilin-type N-terminal cleavage/methylation domain-containing protein